MSTSSRTAAVLLGTLVSLGLAGCVGYVPVRQGTYQPPPQTPYPTPYQAPYEPPYPQQYPPQVQAPPSRPGYQPVPAAPGYGAPQSSLYGQVQSIVLVRAQSQTSGAGAIIGGVLGAVVGNSVGIGGGRDAATAIGALGGVIVGNEVERQNRGARDIWRIDIRLDDGRGQRIDVPSPGGLRVGDRVRLAGNQIQRL